MSNQTCKINNNTPYISLDVCICNEKFHRIPIERRDLGIVGDITNYSMAVVGASATDFTKNYMHNQGVSNKLNKVYEYKLMGNFGVFSYLFKKAEGKDNERAIKEVVFETALGVGIAEIAKSKYGIASKEVAKQIATKTASRLGITMAGRILGGYVGSVIPIAGTIVGAIAGAWLAGKVEKWWFSEEDKQLEKDKAENERIKQREIQYQNKINRINDYLIRNHYIELRELDKDKYGNPIPNSKEAEELCKEASNLKSGYFKTIMLMLSFPNYLDKDKAFYDDFQQKETNTSKDSNNTESKDLKIKPIANAISITIKIEKCYDESHMNKAHTDKLLINKTIYVYNNRFKRVVAKTQTDENGKAVFTEVFVGKEHTIDELRFMVDRDNFTEEGFNASVLKYAPMFNVQNKHKEAKQANIATMKFCFTDIQYAMKDNEVLSLAAHKNVDKIFLDYKVKKSDEILKQYVNFAYRVFDMQDVGIEEYIKNINIENRVKSKLVYCGNGINNNLKVKEEWREKIVVFFAFFNSQINTPYYKLSFINKPIVILDLGNSGAIPTKYEQNSLKRVDIIYDIIQIIENRLKNIVTLIKLQENSNETMNLDERIKKANIIKQNTQSEKILFLSLHIDSEESGKVSGMRCFYNDAAYAEQEKRFIECLKKVYPVANNIYFENKSNLYLTKLTNMASVLVTLGFISNNDDKARLNNKNQRQIIANKLFLAISNYIHGIK